ncbi:MAG: phosphoribosylanthranilate isomerase [Kurthia sp.]|nr:phosphoribosylanthranilate isomerase [Candidatus Kurthia equi]
MVQVKICGLMEKEHVEAAVSTGVDFIGFVFAPSKRRVTVEEAQSLAKLIPNPIQKVGVFVNESYENMIEIAKRVPLDVIQLHGQEPPELVERLADYTVVKAISVRTAADIERASQYQQADYFLFDAPGTDFEGGSGHTFDWSLVEQTGIDRSRTILAGGLHAGNITKAIEQLQPFAVDVSSGVETNGRKDSDKITKFIKNAKSGVNSL